MEEESQVDEMDMFEASEWLENEGIPYEHLVNLEEMRRRIKQEIRDKQNMQQPEPDTSHIIKVSTLIVLYTTYI